MSIKRIVDGSVAIGKGRWKTVYRFENDNDEVYETRMEVEGDFVTISHGYKAWVGKSAWGLQCSILYEIESKQADLAAFKRLLKGGYIEDGGLGENLSNELEVLNEVAACLANC